MKYFIAILMITAMPARADLRPPGLQPRATTAAAVNRAILAPQPPQSTSPATALPLVPTPQSPCQACPPQLQPPAGSSERAVMIYTVLNSIIGAVATVVPLAVTFLDHRQPASATP